PHKEAMQTVAAFLERGKKVVDLSADFRLRDQAVYEKWYQTHSNPELIPEAAYGLPELYREQIKSARLVANPGCYPTATVLAAAPLIKTGKAELTHIIADAKSGASGAGRKGDLALSFAEVNEGVKAYGVFSHRHTPEIAQELSALAGTPVSVTFTPHLIPMQRGILSTVYLQLKNPMSTEELRALYNDFYKGEPFVRVLPGTDVPRTQDVAGSNYCDVAPVAGPDGRVICLGAIDNLIKGASGAAVQNMNLVLGLPETTGLKGVAVVP
ncbi:MAG: N-acetyl-gamma-glutamyl-phosphate reductase, partial [Chrysiogenetes bacterium]|nr:N-acetyl-gamma-glutamyl-phosphate reductase [Chrysiogenetes bacterium]